LSALLQARAETAADAIARGLEAVAGGNDPFYRGLYRVASAWLALLQGRHDEATVELDALASGDQAGHGWLRSGIVIWLRARLDGTPEAMNEAIATLSEPGRTEGITVLPRSSLVADLAVALLETDPEAAIAAVNAARREVGGFAVGRIEVLLAAARIALATGDRDEALAAVTEAIDALTTAGYPIANARAHALLAEILDARREHDRADEAFERAKALAEELPADTLPDAWRPLRL
jgi:tetratricopeptide (TPR) repeat protein